MGIPEGVVVLFSYSCLCAAAAAAVNVKVAVDLYQGREALVLGRADLRRCYKTVLRLLATSTTG